MPDELLATSRFANATKANSPVAATDVYPDRRRTNHGEQLVGRADFKSDKRKQSLYFPESMLAEMKGESVRLSRSLSWIVQRAWKLAKKEVRTLPGTNDVAS